MGWNAFEHAATDSSGWGQFRRMDADEVHVHPVNDLIEHEMTTDCECTPTVEPVKRNDGSIGYLITHQAKDGRE